MTAQQERGTLVCARPAPGTDVEPGRYSFVRCAAPGRPTRPAPKPGPAGAWERRRLGGFGPLLPQSGHTWQASH
ncbi:hypothetical protein [Kitasatospora aureofaciens]